MNKVIVIDLDECLCSINSFRYWIIFSFIILLVTLRWQHLNVFARIVIKRIRGRVDRVEMKRGILSVTEDLPGWAVTWFCRFLHMFSNSTVSGMVSSSDYERVPIVLCTAAPACYVEPYAKKFGFAHVFATPSVSYDGWKENLGKQKLKSLLDHYGEDIKLLAVVTDHHDDLPILERAEKRYIVRPSRATLQVLQGRFDFEVIR